MSSHTPSKNGSALIIVLGFLALLTVLILAFALRTRTDRLSGRTYLENARANQLLHTALARAMENIDLNFTTNYPDALAISSDTNNDPGVPMAGSVDFATEENYLPEANPAIMAQYDTAVNSAKWLPVLDPLNKEIGRIGYIIINTSGLLDANSVGALNNEDQQSTRRNGLSPSELQLSPRILSELDAEGDLIDTEGNLASAADGASAFIHNRDNAWKRFETVRDIKTLNMTQRGGAISGDIESFNVFSLFPGNTYAGLELSEDLDEELFETILTRDCGFTTTEAEHIIENYLDYIDADSIPRNLTGSSPEAVPMINEIWLEEVSFEQSVSDPSNVNYQISGELYVETWYPFDNAAPEANLELVAADPTEGSSTNNQGAIEILEGEDFIGDSDFITAVINYSNATKAIILELEFDSFATSADSNFTVYYYTFNFSDTLALDFPFQEGADTAANSLRFLNEEIEVIVGNTVDVVENTDLQINVEGEAAIEDSIAYSCFDPRINHEFGTHWKAADNYTPAAINDITEWGEEMDLEDKESIRFHVSNQPMTNAAELGHLSTGEPWDTIRLYAGDDRPDPVLDYFYTSEERTNGPTRSGLINVHSPHTNVLATAFNQAPIADIGDGITEDEARTLGQTLASHSGIKTRSAAGYALNNNFERWTELNDAEKDSIIGNTYRLFGWRDTSYTIFLIAQTGTDINNNGLEDEEIRASQQAVVNVWRDPLTEKAAITFFGLSDTLRGSEGIGAQGWDTLLNAFAP